ncbi:MAG TPA: hypothetical protein PLD03_04640 [Thiomonas arsenitoxydans]|nr:hypothetical protein [Thiomonas arsenitoxydans]
MKSADKAKAAQRRSALDLVKKLNAAADATNRFLLACLDAGEAGRGLDDGRVILIRNMTEYACHLDAVYNKEGST